MRPHATKDDYERALAGIEFPASSDAIIRQARDRGGIDSEVIAMFERLPDISFSSIDEMVAAIRGIYAAAGVAAADTPL